MSEGLPPFVDVGVAQTLAWLESAHGVAGEVQGMELRGGTGLARLTLSDPSAGSERPTRKASLAVVPLFDSDEETEARRAALEAALSGVEGLVLWTPPASELPDANAAAIVERIRAAASGLQAGERGEAGFPVTLAVRKVDDEGSNLP